MTKYVYIVRRLGPDSEVEYEEAVAELDNAKELMRKRMAGYDIWRQQRYNNKLTQKEKDRIRTKYGEMTIKLRKSDWRWEHIMGGPYAALFELKRLEIKESI